jgi:hypothetical protein
MDPVISNAEISTEGSSSFYYILKYVIFILILGSIMWIMTHLGYILSYFGYTLAEVTKQTVNLSAEGSKAIVDATANTLNSGVNILENGLKMDDKKSINNIDNICKTLLINQEEDQVMNLLQNSKNHIVAPNEFQPHEASAMGFCYVGEDLGFRSCIKVGKADRCMSGDIFPTKDICINPSLRA